jgi:membrane protein implicated in regulation of membrane protease activity
MAKKKGKKVAGNTLKWLLALFMFSGCMVYWFSFASIIFALLGVYFLPIAPIQNFFKRFMPKKKILRGIIAFVIFFFGAGALCTAGALWISPMAPAGQFVFFLASSLILFFGTRRLFPDIFKGEKKTGNVSLDENEFSGELAAVTEEITPDKPGKINFHGTVRTAESERVCSAGEMVKIIRRTNLTYHVK